MTHDFRWLKPIVVKKRAYSRSIEVDQKARGGGLEPEVGMTIRDLPLVTYFYQLGPTS